MALLYFRFRNTIYTTKDHSYILKVYLVDTCEVDSRRQAYVYVDAAAVPWSNRGTVFSEDSPGIPLIVE